MTEERSKSPRARMFVALDLPGEVRDGIGAWSGTELTDPALRPVPAENLHITLAFLGQTPEKAVQGISAAIEESLAPAPLVELLDPVRRPERGRARLLALPAVSPAAESIQARLGGLLASEGLYKPEKRPFWPHLTLARVRPQGRGSRQPRVVERPPGDLPKTLRKAFHAVRVTLYRSELQPSGARYVPLAQVELSADGRQ